MFYLPPIFEIYFLIYPQIILNNLHPKWNT